MAPQTQTQYDSAQLATAARTSLRQLADQLDVLRIVESNVADWTQLQAALADAAAMVAEMCARERDAREAEMRANKRAEAADKAAKRAKDDDVVSCGGWCGVAAWAIGHKWHAPW